MNPNDMKNFLDQDIQFLDEENVAIRETVHSLKNAYEELRNEEMTLIILEKFIIQLKSKMKRFEDNYNNNMMRFLSTAAAQRERVEYPSWMNEAIVSFIELTMDAEIIYNITLKMDTYFEKMKNNIKDENKFYTIVKGIHNEVYNKLSLTSEVFGINMSSRNNYLRYETPESYQRTKKEHVDKTFNNVKTEFIKKYNLQERR